MQTDGHGGWLKVGRSNEFASQRLNAAEPSGYYRHGGSFDARPLFRPSKQSALFWPKTESLDGKHSWYVNKWLY